METGRSFEPETETPVIPRDYGHAIRFRIRLASGRLGLECLSNCGSSGSVEACQNHARTGDRQIRQSIDDLPLNRHESRSLLCAQHSRSKGK